MTLMKFLSTTNVLSEAKHQPHRYKVRTDGLPTFGNAAAPAVKKPGGASVARAMTEPVSVRRPTAARSGWMEKLNPFAAQGAPVPRTPVQGELSLDKVKPVRSDLSDTDLELVAVEKKPEPAAVPAKIETAELSGTPWWERVRGLWRRAS